MCGWVYCEKYPLSVLEIISDFFPLKQCLLMVSLPCVRFKVCVFKFGDTVVLTGLLWGFFLFVFFLKAMLQSLMCLFEELVT